MPDISMAIQSSLYEGTAALRPESAGESVGSMANVL